MAAIYPATGVISGLAPDNEAGNVGFKVIANGTAPNAVQTFTLTIAHPKIVLTPPGGLRGNLTNPFSVQLHATGGVPPMRWSLDSGTLPAGLALGPDGVISGTPTAIGTSLVRVRATDSALPHAFSATESVNVVISARKLTITTRSLPAATLGVPYSQPITTIMGIPPLRWWIPERNPAAGRVEARLAHRTDQRHANAGRGGHVHGPGHDSTTPTPMATGIQLHAQRPRATGQLSMGDQRRQQRGQRVRARRQRQRHPAVVDRRLGDRAERHQRRRSR